MSADVDRVPAPLRAEIAAVTVLAEDLRAHVQRVMERYGRLNVEYDTRLHPSLSVPGTPPPGDLDTELMTACGMDALSAVLADIDELLHGRDWKE